MRIAVLDDYLGVARDLADWSAIDGAADVVVFDRAFGSAAATIEALRGFEVLCLMRDRTPLPASTLAALPDLRMITFTGVRNSTLDLAAAAAAGITVCYTDRNRTEVTTELVWALIMAVLRQVPANDASLRAGTWQHGLGTTLSGKTLGLVGLGRIGRPVAGYARAFGMPVIAWSPHLTAEVAAESGARAVPFDELLASADVVSVHVVGSEGTRGLIGAREIGLMRPDAYLVNTSRGPIVDTAALVAALHAGTIAGAGLDVYDTEPLRPGDPLLGAPNTVLLPHIGFVTSENMRLFYEDTVENVTAWLAGTPIRVLRPPFA